MSKAFWTIIAVIVIIFGGILIFKDDKAAAPSTNGAKASQHTMGAGKTGVVLVEYGDFQCQFCGAYYPTVKAVVDKYKDQITFQFRNLPLTSLHQNAFAASRAAEAADKQGKYWEMHDTLYQNQTAWANSDKPQTIFEEYAQGLGMDVAKFRKDAASSAVNDTINADLAAFADTKAQMSTPTFFINGKKVTIPNVYEDFDKAIANAIADAAKATQKQ